ncbi:MAG: methionine--tRNA ligase subunit beta [Candidatus Aenigmarchaeota archaeon]|nr:methionine--tRNA ligase subunit beta [Candidatus Aenigmarchaeota archaeon]
MVSFKEFQSLDLRVGRILSVDSVPNADKLYKLSVDMGDKKITLVAGLRPYYKPEEMKGKKIIVVANLDPVILKGVKSEGMLLAAQEGNVVSLVTIDKDVKPGSKVS